MNYPKCKSSNHKKNGQIGERQRYKCHDCGYKSTVELKSTFSPPSVKRQALQLYLEELRFRSIGRVLGVSHVSVQIDFFLVAEVRKLDNNSGIN
jgi:transposase